MKKLAISLLPVLLLITSSSHGLKVYKWRDSQGIHYSDRRPPSMAEDPTQVRIDSDTIGGKHIEPRAVARFEDTETLNNKSSAPLIGGVAENSPQASASGSTIGGGGGSGGGGSGGGGSGGGGSGDAANREGGEIGVASAGSESDTSAMATVPVSSGGGDIAAAASGSDRNSNGPASASGIGKLTGGAVRVSGPSSVNSLGGSQLTINGGQAATTEMLATTNTKSSVAASQSEPEPQEITQLETIVVAGSGTISSPVPTSTSGGASSGTSKYYNSDEKGCDGTDPTVLMCDDFEDGSWGETNCDTDGGPRNPANDGWCMNIYHTWPDPEGTGFARCGRKGVGGTNCAATSRFLDPGAPYPNGRESAGMTGRHAFAPADTSYDEVWIRWYLRELPGFIPGHEKALFISDIRDRWLLILNKHFGKGELAIISQKEDKWMGQNQGNTLKIVPGHWYYIEVHIKLEDPGAQNGIYELWMDDCGTDGLGCTGPGTLRARHKNRQFRMSPTQKIGLVRLTNWGNPGSTGEQYYDQVYVATRRIGPM